MTRHNRLQKKSASLEVIEGYFPEAPIIPIYPLGRTILKGEVSAPNQTPNNEAQVASLSRYRHGDKEFAERILEAQIRIYHS